MYNGTYLGVHTGQWGSYLVVVISGVVISQYMSGSRCLGVDACGVAVLGINVHG